MVRITMIKVLIKTSQVKVNFFSDIRICKDEKSITEINIITTTTAVIKNELKYF